MNVKLKRNEVLFYLSYIILYVSLFLGDVYDNVGLDTATKVLRLCSYGLIAASCVNLKLRKKELFQLIVVLLLTLIYGVRTGDLYWSILVLLIYNSKKIDIKKIFSISCKILICGIIVVLTCCLIGLLPDVLTARNTTIESDFNRHSFGFYHSNVLPLLIFYLEVYYVCIVAGKVKHVNIICFMVVAVLVNMFCSSRNSIVLSLALSVFVLFERKRLNYGQHKILYKATAISVPGLSIFSFAMLFLLLRGGIWNTVDTFFSGRFRLAIFKMRRVGLHLINIMSNESFINDNITYVNGKILSTIVLDNGYLYVMLRYGILILVFYAIVAYLLAQKSKKNACILGTLIAVFLSNFIDNDLVDYSFLPFILWAFNDLKWDSVMQNIKQRTIVKKM